ncbi:hypothetical protein PG2006B_1091 [Bifidobacterium animalis subsp. animalis]|nr:hypothetical protein PG2006B_1091 [Bifidobacterium animalis subsp. animalis]
MQDRNDNQGTVSTTRVIAKLKQIIADQAATIVVQQIQIEDLTLALQEGGTHDTGAESVA